MKANELRELYLSYYLERGHKVAAAALLVPENDSSVLYTTAGMQPLIPFLLGKKHPLGNRLVNVQRCVRTGDIEEVGDDYHLTVFEMLGNWSLGDYFKVEAIKMSYDFLVNQLGIPKDRLAVTVHSGNDKVSKDKEAAETWLHLGIEKEKIFYYGDEENWWGPAGETGPCGPDSEMFYINDSPDCRTDCGPACGCGKYVELGNNVFMTYNKDKEGTLSELKQKNIDVGLGFERLLILASGLDNVYETDLFLPIITKVESLTALPHDATTQKNFRVIAEHMRASVFILADPANILPSNGDQGYTLRRLIRRTIRVLLKMGVEDNILPDLADVVIKIYKEAYPEVWGKKDHIKEALTKEYNQFNKTLKSGLKMADRCFNNLNENETFTGERAFKLYDTYGFPLELTIELAKEKHIEVDVDGFNECYKQHQENSRKAAEGKFKGGLAENNEDSIKLHTATHLLNAGLRHVLGDTVSQRGSHISSQRLRFDFSYDRKMTKDEIEKVETFVNEVINRQVKVQALEMPLDEAKAKGAIGVFDSKYEEKVKVYCVGTSSMEICGGPHVKNTSELGRFKILKEQSSSAGVRRIKAVLE